MNSIFEEHSSSYHSFTGEKLDLSYFLEWRPRLWAPGVRWLLQDPSRFQNKNVLEIGCRAGKMSCFFALLGAQVRGVDIDEAALEKAEVEAKRWKVEDRLIFQGYGGDPGEISGEDYDFVFTKSVLVVVPQLKSFLARLGDKVRVGGELLAVENLEGNAALNFFRRTVIHRRWNSFEQKFWGVDEDFTSAFAPTFTVAEQKNFFWLVAAIRAIKQIETTSKTIQSS